MNPVRVAPEFSASPQIAPSDVETIASLGFATVMCNRPDGEEPGQPDFAEIEAEAARLGLATSHVPVVSGAMTAADVEAFRAAVATLPTPIFAYCRSGTRSQTLWRLANGTL
jgi:sulfide:quinone oxidoreductase